MPRVIRVDPINPDREKLRIAADILKRGGIVAFPTETVYGLGADALNPEAVKRVFQTKGRPPDNPIIVHINSFDMLYQVAESSGEDIERILRILWPGPFTVILRKKAIVPSVTTAGLPHVAVRMPAHPVALGIIEELRRPIAAPSANKSGRPSPTVAEHVIEDLGDSVDLVVDGGETFFGVESTIIDLTGESPTLVRPGPIDPEYLENIIGKKILIPPFARGFGEAEKAIAPGTKYRHYAPDKQLLLIENINNSCIERIAKDLINRGLKICVVGYREFLYIRETLGIEYISMGSLNNKYEIARNLYKALRSVDRAQADLCIVLGVDERGIGLAIMNRLRKASGGNIIRCQ